MEIEHYHFTPEEVEGVFTIRKITDFEEDEYCYLTIDLHDAERVVIYHYDAAGGLLLRTLQLPCRAVFEGGHLRTGGITHP